MILLYLVMIDAFNTIVIPLSDQICDVKSESI
jgi:hypothetical protein